MNETLKNLYATLHAEEHHEVLCLVVFLISLLVVIFFGLVRYKDHLWMVWQGNLPNVSKTKRIVGLIALPIMVLSFVAFAAIIFEGTITDAQIGFTRIFDDPIGSVSNLHSIYAKSGTTFMFESTYPVHIRHRDKFELLFPYKPNEESGNETYWLVQEKPWITKCYYRNPDMLIDPKGCEVFILTDVAEKRYVVRYVDFQETLRYWKGRKD